MVSVEQIEYMLTFVLFFYLFILFIGGDKTVCLHLQYADIKKYFSQCTRSIRGQGWRSGESTRLSPMWLGFDSRTWSHVG